MNWNVQTNQIQISVTNIYVGVNRFLKCHLTGAQELATPGSHGSPQVGGELLGVLVLQNELRNCSFAQRAGRPHGPDPSFLFHQLTVHQSHQLPLHGAAQHALSSITQPHS